VTTGGVTLTLPLAPHTMQRLALPYFGSTPLPQQ
jgi:hypothetical protein